MLKKIKNKIKSDDKTCYKPLESIEKGKGSVWTGIMHTYWMVLWFLVASINWLFLEAPPPDKIWQGNQGKW